MIDEKIINVKKVLEITNGKLVYGEDSITCVTFSRDSRIVEPGDVYLGIKGENFNGSAFYLDALEKGASVCILQDVKPDLDKVKKFNKVAIIVVDDVVKALQQIATYKRSLYSIPVVAITGSVGKTSTKDITASVLGRKYKVLKTQGNLNNQIGLPLTILKLEDHEALVVEMGMGNLGEISNLTKIAKPNVAVITNIGTSHIGNLGSRQNILKAKLEILEGLQKDGVCIINNDNDLLNEWNRKNTNYRVITYGIDEKSDYNAINIKLDENSSEYDVEIDKKKYHIDIAVGGRHFIYNSLCAICIGKIFSIPIEEIKEGIEKFELTKSRMEVHKKDDITIVNDCYNASYDSMKAAIEYLGAQKNCRKIAVLGDMLELGVYSKELHEKVAPCIIENKIDELITVGEQAENIAKVAINLGMEKKNVNAYMSNSDAINKIKSIMKDNDVILIKASNGMNFKQIVEAIL